MLPVAALAHGAEVGLPVLTVTGAAPGPRLVCVAGIHGNEPEGVTALLDLWDEIEPTNLAGTLMLVPVANPPAFHAGERRNPSDPLDMNRIFPGRADGTTTERLADRLWHDIVLGADFVLSLHGWGRGGLVVPYTEYPRDSSVTAASRAAAAAFGLPWLEAFDWPPGMMVAVCARHGIPAIEPEIGGLECSVPERRALYRRGLANLLRHLGMTTGASETPDQVQDVSRVELTAPTGGVLRRRVELGDPVQPGTDIAVITGLCGETLAKVLSPIAGFVAAQRLTGAVNPGEQVAVIFQPVLGNEEE
ncbi:MAG: succinylglutamate desuccinylase/aspartoacylase family protein [Thermomicrobiales bacterium]